MKGFLLIFLGGGLGSLTRSLISKLIPVSKNNFPLNTLIANFFGCFLVGYLIGWFLNKYGYQNELYLFQLSDSVVDSPHFQLLVMKVIVAEIR